MPQAEGMPFCDWPEALRDSDTWAFATMRPGTDPFVGLVSAFMQAWFKGADAADPARVEQRERWTRIVKEAGHENRHAAGLADLFDATQELFRKAGQPVPSEVLLNINQFEELYALVPADLRVSFARLLKEGLSDRRLRVIGSIRTDYFGQFLQS
jgi:hypothetical protein